MACFGARITLTKLCLKPSVVIGVVDAMYHGEFCLGRGIGFWFCRFVRCSGLLFDGVGCPEVPGDFVIAGSAMVFAEGLPLVWHKVVLFYDNPSRSNDVVRCSTVPKREAIHCFFANVDGDAISSGNSKCGGGTHRGCNEDATLLRRGESNCEQVWGIGPHAQSQAFLPEVIHIVFLPRRRPISFHQ